MLLSPAYEYKSVRQKHLLYKIVNPVMDACVPYDTMIFFTVLVHRIY